MQIPTGERLEGKPGRGGSAAFGARPFRQWGARRPALPLSAGPPGGIPSHRGGGPNAMRGGRVRLGVTRGRGEPETPECCPGSLGGDPEGCRGLCPRVSPSALTALLARHLSFYPDLGSRGPESSPPGTVTGARGGRRLTGDVAGSRNAARVCSGA